MVSLSIAVNGNLRLSLIWRKRNATSANIDSDTSGYAENGTGQVVIGHDARHNSDKFARLAAAAFMAKGFGILWFEENVHTPMVRLGHAFAGLPR